MGLFDAIREKAGELLSGATEKVGDLTGVGDLSQSVTDAAGQATGTAQDLGETATGAAADLTAPVTDAADTVTGSLPDLPEPYRP